MAIVQDELVLELDGKNYRPVMVWDDDQDQEQPVVILCGTILGRNEFLVERARAIQSLGYVSVALDLYGDGLAAEDFEEGRVHMEALLADREELRLRLEASVDFVKQQSNVDSMKIAVIGYCFGGLCALDVARSRDDVAAVASFHGNLSPPPRSVSGPVNAKVLIMHGDKDPLVPPEQVDAVRDEFTRLEADWQVHTYGFTYHSFAVPSANSPERGLQFNAIAEQRSWASLTAFLQETF